MNHIQIEQYGNTVDSIEFKYYDIDLNQWTIYVDVNVANLTQDSYGIEGSEWIEVDEETLDYTLEVVNQNGDTRALSESESEYVHSQIVSFLLENLC